MRRVTWGITGQWHRKNRESICWSPQFGSQWKSHWSYCAQASWVRNWPRIFFWGKTAQKLFGNYYTWLHCSLFSNFKTRLTFRLITYSSKYSAWFEIQNMATGKDRYSIICKWRRKKKSHLLRSARWLNPVVPKVLGPVTSLCGSDKWQVMASSSPVTSRFGDITCLFNQH